MDPDDILNPDTYEIFEDQKLVKNEEFKEEINPDEEIIPLEAESDDVLWLSEFKEEEIESDDFGDVMVVETDEAEGDEAKLADNDEQESTNSPKELENFTYMGMVRIVRYGSQQQRFTLDADDEDAIVIYKKKVEDIRVALYKGYEYMCVQDHYEREITWTCSKSRDCPALLLIGAIGNDKVYEVNEHNCIENLDVLKQPHFQFFTPVDVMYFDGYSMPISNSKFLESLGLNVLILCRDNQEEKIAFYNGRNYVKSTATNDFFLYVCLRDGCLGSFKVSRQCIGKKMVMETRCHTCRVIKPPTNQSSELDRVVPNLYTAVKLVFYRTSRELAFFLNLNQLYPTTTLPIVYAKQGDKSTVFYQNYEYCRSFRTAEWHFKCKIKSCPGDIELTTDLKTVREVSSHTCDLDDTKRSCLYNLIKLSKLSDMKCVEPSVISLGNMEDEEKLEEDKDSGYVKVKFKHLVIHNVSDPELNPDDCGTVVAFFENSSKRHLYFYKGHCYNYGANLEVCLCARSKSCLAVLNVQKETSEVLEVGTHSCSAYDASRTSTAQPCPPLTPISSFNKSPGYDSDTFDTLKYTTVKINNCLNLGVNMAELNPNDQTTACVFKDEAGRPIIYYKGHTYHYYSRNRIIYWCAKSRMCPAALKPHPSRRYELAEMGEHVCTKSMITLATSASTVELTCSVETKRKRVKFNFILVKDFNTVPDVNPVNENIVTVIINEGQQSHNAVYYNGYTYVDDRSLSCDRGSLIMRRSCNLVYMCVKSNVCSAGLSTNIDRSTALEVGLHSCLSPNDHADPDKLFRELTPVTICYSPNGAVAQDKMDSKTVVTYLENGSKVADYKGFTYLERVTGCSAHMKACKCLYICRKSAVCTAAILLDANNAVLEVGLHCCQRQTKSVLVTSENTLRRTSFIPAIVTSPLLLLTSRSAPAVEKPDKSSTENQTARNKRKGGVPEGCDTLSKTKKDSLKFQPVTVFNDLENKLEEVGFEEQRKFLLANTTCYFRGFVHTKSGTSGSYMVYDCANKQLTYCKGQLLFGNSKIVSARQHICEEIKKNISLKSESNSVIIYCKGLDEVLLYRGLMYGKKQVGNYVDNWECAQEPHCKAAIKMLGNSVLETGRHICGENAPLLSTNNKSDVVKACQDVRLSNLTKIVSVKPNSSEACQLFEQLTGQDVANTQIGPILDESGKLCMIYNCHIYTLSYAVLAVSEWACIQTSCSALLRFDGTKILTLANHCCLEELSTSKKARPAIKFIPRKDHFSVKIFHGERDYVLYAGYIYQLNEVQKLGDFTSLICIYRDTSFCRGNLTLRNGVPITVLQQSHSCKQLTAASVKIDDCNERESEALKIEAPSDVYVDECTERQNEDLKIETEEITIKEECLETATVKYECDDSAAEDDPRQEHPGKIRVYIMPDLVPFDAPKVNSGKVVYVTREDIEEDGEIRTEQIQSKAVFGNESEPEQSNKEDFLDDIEHAIPATMVMATKQSKT